MDGTVLHERLANAPWLDPALWRLPGVKPLDLEDWLIRDEAYAEQMALRDHLIETNLQAVHAIDNNAVGAASECLTMVLEALAKDTEYTICADRVGRPDGKSVPIEHDRPLVTIGRLIQADVCLMEEGPDGHVLTGAILCFPASWTLSEKMGRALPGIHRPVPNYDQDIARRVQRLFDAMRPERPLWRANALIYSDPRLFQPKSETDGPALAHANREGDYLRTERQALRRLKDTGAIVFTIQTTVIPIEALTDAERAGLADAGLAQF